LITLAIDTSEKRGSVALRAAGEYVAGERHEERSDYSEWLLPATDRVLKVAGIRVASVELYAVATGPGSFTGVRVGLATVKAWCEVYSKPVVGVSRLEALARSEKLEEGLLAAFYDAQRGQIFAGLYRSGSGRFARIGDEMVIAPEAFLEFVAQEAGRGAVNWVSPDPDLLTQLDGWEARTGKGDRMRRGSAELASTIAWLAEQKAVAGEFTGRLELDANYVRRSDAEIFWKGPSAHVR
jgi:tRNA threonylcarbamoyladenosine biosynthesis protein TsaB